MPDARNLDGSAPDPEPSWPPSPRARAAEQVTHATRTDAPRNHRLSELARRAAEATGSATGQISMLTDRQVAITVERSRFVAETAPVDAGVALPFEDTICALALRADAAVVVPDTSRDARVSSLPAVLAGIVGAYLGSPIRSADGAVLGVLCVYDERPRDWSDTDVKELARYAADVSGELQRSTEPRSP
jgi:GAF domain-containing protein